jgi:hypothetical protein
MKVVINRCYGGFGLSEQAIDKIYDRKNIAFEKKDDQGFVHYFKAGHLGDFDHYLSEHDIARDDPDLVAVVEELGNLANSRYSELKVVEVPDDVKWKINEYDGLEHVAEVHRIWD